jgi:hypothetical protein
MKQITTKIGNMRKEKDFVVYPVSYSGKENVLYIQSDNACARFNTETGEGVMSNKGSCPMDYYLTFKGQKFTCPPDVIKQALEIACPVGKLEQIGPGVFMQG